MRLTRYTIQKGVKRTKRFINKNKSLIHKVASNICRSNININYNRKVLDNIELIFDSEENHWAETDNKNIYINTYKDFTPSLLYYTLLHEALHGMFTRTNNHELSEFTEHRIMYAIDKRLI